MTRTAKSILIIFGVLLVDQLLKFWVKTNMVYFNPINVFGEWFQLDFVENKGMAFGMIFPGENGKLFLSIFRLVAIGGIAFYLVHLIRIKAHNGLIITMSLILAGAAGNMIDSAFYGLIFSASGPGIPEPAVLFPEGGGYSTFLHGNVVDMFSFKWFRPVFNIADASITSAVFILLFRQRKFFAQMQQQHEADAESGADATSAATEVADSSSAPGPDQKPAPSATSDDRS